MWSCSRWGLPSRVGYPNARCAFTAPFHPYLFLRMRSIWDAWHLRCVASVEEAVYFLWRFP